MKHGETRGETARVERTEDPTATADAAGPARGTAEGTGPAADAWRNFEGGSVVAELARTVAREDRGTEEIEDDDTSGGILDYRRAIFKQLTQAPALTGSELTYKLAALVAEIIMGAEEPDSQTLRMAASCLADAVRLQAGPICQKLAREADHAS